jgi:glycosyltransferase involved in cell wall biosynthesis
MRIVIDFQGGQTTGSRTRGIGRYSTSLVQAMLRNRDKHQIYLVLNGLFADTIEPIRKAFEELLPQEYIRVWKAPAPVSHLAAPRVRREVAQLIRESFLAELEPDVVLITSLFEGAGDDAVTSVGQLIADVPTAAILFDLIPYVNKELYLQDPDIEAWYLGKIECLRRTDLLLAISESSRQEAIRYLGVDQSATINISSAADSHFVRRVISSSRESELRKKYGFDGPFVMCTSGLDYRKNVDGLIRGYARLTERIRRQHQLVIVCSLSESDRERLVGLAKKAQLSDRELVLTGFVSENDLVDLYNLCSVFVFPSWHEGFGLPALEAMSCGAPVVGANRTSIPEVIGREDALFDPHDESDIAERLCCALTDDHFRSSLAQHGLKQAKLFSWDRTAKLALFALEELHRRKMPAQASVKNARPKLAYLSPLPPERSGISNYSAELLPELGRYYDIDLVVSEYSPVNPPFPVRSVDWFRENAQRYDRIL